MDRPGGSLGCDVRVLPRAVQRHGLDAAEFRRLASMRYAQPPALSAPSASRLLIATTATTPYHAGMSPDALEFLDNERDAFRPFEALADLTDEELNESVAGAHGWSGRQLMGHLLSGHEVALAVAAELARNETSAAKERADADWDARGGDAVNAEIDARWAALSMDDLRARFDTLPRQLRDRLRVVPERRWLTHRDHQQFFLAETTAHYEDHVDDLAAILTTAGR